jgi:hypothetical protein
MRLNLQRDDYSTVAYYATAMGAIHVDGVDTNGVRLAACDDDAVRGRRSIGVLTDAADAVCAANLVQELL